MNGCRKTIKQRLPPLENGTPAKRVRLNGKPLGRPPTKNRIVQNGNASQTHEMDDESLRMAFKSVLPADIVQNDDDTEGNSINETTNGSTEPNGSPSIKQKVKYIPPNRFLHIKPPPPNTQKIYVKQQNGNQSYTLGVKNIGTTDVPLIHNSKPITVNNKEQTSSSPSSPAKKTENGEENATTEATLINDIDIFDIPILLADKDGNIIDDNQSETPKTSTQTAPAPPSTINSIDIICEEIVNDTIIGEGNFSFDCLKLCIV